MSQTFFAWLKTQMVRPDSVGWFATQIDKKPQFVPSLASDPDKWQTAIAKIKGSFRKPMMAAFETAFKEWGNLVAPSEASYVEVKGEIEEFDPNDTMQVVSTVGRLKRSVERDVESGEVEEEETLAVHRFRGPVAHLGMKGQVRVNLGNYEHIEIQTFISSPCYPEETGDMADFLSRWTGNRFSKELENLMDIKGGAKARKEVIEANKNDPFVPKKRGFSETAERMGKNKLDEEDGEIEGDDSFEEVVEDGGEPLYESEPVVDDGSDPLF